MPSDRDVFVNCPFDALYRDLFDATVFAILRSGFVARSALEVDDAGVNRFDKICAIIGECRFSVHDISRTELSAGTNLPRFNMPLELGLFLGAKKFGGAKHRSKCCIVFDREAHRYQKFISDIAGQDIHQHGNEPETLIAELATWLRGLKISSVAPGGTKIAKEYHEFRQNALPHILEDRQLEEAEMTFGDFTAILTAYFPDAERDASSA